MPDYEIQNFPTTFAQPVGFMEWGDATLGSGKLAASTFMGFLNTKEARSGVYVDGTSFARIASALGTVGAVGASPWSHVCVADIPESNPTVFRIVASVMVSESSNNANSSCYWIGISTAGQMVISFRTQANPGAGATDVTINNVVANYGGRTLAVLVDKTSSTSVTVYFNGVSVGTFALGATDGVLSGYLLVSRAGAEWVGNVYRNDLYNYSLGSVANRIDRLQRAGWRPLLEDLATPGNQVYPNGAFGGDPGYDTIVGASASGFAVTRTTGGNGGMVSRIDRVQVGARYRVNFTATLNSGAVPYVQITQTGVAVSSAQTSVVNGANSITIIATRSGTGSNVSLQFGTAGNTDYSISGLVVQPLGVVCSQRLGSGAGLQYQDETSNKLDALVMSGAIGVVDLIPDRTAAFRATLTFGAGANVLFGGGSIVDTRRKWRIRSISGTSSAATNLSFGNISGGAQYVNAQAAAPGDFDINTFVTRLVNGTAIWVTSSAAATVTIVIELMQNE